MLIQRQYRAGLSLTEVLVAMFIMALGMIALLTLFPLGALQMNQAIKDERCAQVAHNADNTMRMHWKKYVVERTNAGLPADPFTNAFANPYDNAFGNPAFGNSTPPAQNAKQNLMPILGNANISEQSYPVYVDPRGFRGRPAAGQFAQERFWLAGRVTNPAYPTNVPRISRRPLGVTEPITNPAALNTAFLPKLDPYRVATLMDDLTFNENGSADIRENDAAKSPLPVERQGRFTWAWMLQRPATGVATNATMTVVCYDNVKPDFPTLDGEICYSNAAINQATFVPGSQRVSFNFTAAAGGTPNIKAGGWILDGSSNPIIQQGNGNFVRAAVRVANFYRVTGVEITVNAAGTGTCILDLQTPIKALPNMQNVPANVSQYFGDLYVLKGVAEVFVRRPLSADDLPE